MIAFIDDILFNRNNKWAWFYVTFMTAMLPIWVSINLAFWMPEVPKSLADYIKMSDVVFIGLMMNITNLSLIGTGAGFETKLSVIYTSFILMFSLTLSLTIVYLHTEFSLAFIIFVFVQVLISIYVNYATYRSFIHKRKRKKRDR